MLFYVTGMGLKPTTIYYYFCIILLDYIYLLFLFFIYMRFYIFYIFIFIHNIFIVIFLPFG